MKEAARLARMAIINNLDQESKEKLKKQEFQVYRRKKLNQPPLLTKQNPHLWMYFFLRHPKLKGLT
jgi:hypothetical protein